MTPFNPNDPKYISCCCAMHVVELARVFMIINIIQVVGTGSFTAVVPVLLVAIGAYGVFKEDRAWLVVYVWICIFCTMAMLGIVLAAHVFGAALLFFLPENAKAQIPTEYGIGFFIVLLMISVIVLLFTVPPILVYWNMAEFLKDRELAIGGAYQIVGITVAAPPPSAPPAYVEHAGKELHEYP